MKRPSHPSLQEGGGLEQHSAGCFAELWLVWVAGNTGLQEPFQVLESDFPLFGLAGRGMGLPGNRWLPPSFGTHPLGEEWPQLTQTEMAQCDVRGEADGGVGGGRGERGNAGCSVGGQETLEGA